MKRNAWQPIHVHGRPSRPTKHWPVIVFFSAFLFYMELMLKLLSGDGFSDLLFPVIMLFPAAILLALLCGAFSPKANFIIACSSAGIITVYFMVQYMYRFIFKTYMSFYSATVGVGQAMGFTGTIFSAIGQNIFQLIALLLPLAAMIIFGKRYIEFPRLTVRKTVIRGVAFVLAFIAALTILVTSDKSMYSAFDLYYNTNSIDMSVKKLGLVTATRLDIQRVLFGFEEKGLENLADINSETAGGEESAKPGIVVAPVGSTPKPTETPAPIDTSPNTLNIDFDKLIAESPDENVTALHEYFKSAEPTMKNEYTGIFEGYNLIMLTAEGFSHMAVSEELTPTLHRLINTGFVFDDFYTPVWSVSTSDGEYVACTGLIPEEGVWSFMKSGEEGNDMRFTMGEQFKRMGCGTFAYHNHTFDYYGRDISHPNMGYTYKGLGNGLEVEETWPESDLEMMEKTVDDWISLDHFHAYYMTVSGHMNYSFEGNMMSSRHREEVAHLELSEQARAYIACNIELDKAIEYLLARLEEAGKLDNTLIVMSADHYPYGLEKEAIDELSGHKVEENFELYKNAAIVWSGSMTEPVHIEKPTCSMDLIPTISNLLSLPYDSRMLSGSDALSSTMPLIVFNDASFIKGDLRYNANTDEAISTNGTVYTDEQIGALVSAVASKNKVAAAILDYDYFSYLPEEIMMKTAPAPPGISVATPTAESTGE